jgi:hypothetical protein
MRAETSSLVTVRLRGDDPDHAALSRKGATGVIVVRRHAFPSWTLVFSGSVVGNSLGGRSAAFVAGVATLGGSSSSHGVGGSHVGGGCRRGSRSSIFKTHVHLGVDSRPPRRQRRSRRPWHRRLPSKTCSERSRDGSYLTSTGRAVVGDRLRDASLSDPLHLGVDSRRASRRRQRRLPHLLWRLPSRPRPELPQDGSGLFLAAVPQRRHDAP